MRKLVGLLLVLAMLSCGMVLPAFASETDSSDGLVKLLPEDILASEKNFEKYFRDTTGAFTFEEVDGEYVMTVLATDSHGYFVLSKDPIPYETYTITMDVAINLSTSDSWETASGDEACMLIGCTNPLGQGHQVRSMTAYKSTLMQHELIGTTPGQTFTAVKDDGVNTLVPAGDDMYITYRFEVYPDEILVYFEGDNITTPIDPVYLTSSDGCTGEKSYFGFRGSREGWKVKNIQVYEGIYDPATYVPPVEETEEPTEVPTPDNTQGSEGGSTEQATPNNNGGNDVNQEDDGMGDILMVAIIAAVVIIAGCAVVIIFVMKKKK